MFGKLFKKAVTVIEPPRTTYLAPVMCSNCEKGASVRRVVRPDSTVVHEGSYLVEIPLGKSVEEYLPQAECSYCGCRTLRSQAEKKKQ